MPGVTVPREVKVPVPVPCVSEVPARPALRTAAELDALGDYQWALAMEAERVKLTGHVQVLEAVVEGCSKIKIPTS